MASIKFECENLEREIEESKARMERLNEGSPLYGLEYGCIKEKERFLEKCRKWSDY